MAETTVPVTSGSGNNVDFYQLSNTNLRQAVVVGDSTIGGNVAPVQATDPTSNTEGLVVRDVNTSAVVAALGGSLSVYVNGTAGTLNVQLKPGTLAVQLDPGHELGSIKGINSTVAVYFDQSSPAVNVQGLEGANKRPFMMNTDGAIKIYDIVTGTINTVGAVTNITNSINVYVGATSGTLNVQLKPGTLAVQLDPGHLLGSVTANAGTGTLTVAFDPGHELGSVKGINNSINVYLGSTAGTLIVKPDPAGTYFINGAYTASIFTVSGSTSGISVSGVNLVAPSTAYSFKVFAYSLQTTGAVSLTAKFVNGAGGGQTEFWRPIATAAGVTGVQGANLAVPPPGYIFATGSNTSLNLLLDTASLVHYSVSYIKESA